MRNLLIGIVLVLLIGLAGFLYRNEIDQSALGIGKIAVSVPTVNQACTDDAKICPDGTAVGRTGPNCSFAACAAPNVEITSGSSTIGFVLPSGYTRLASASGAPLLGEYTKASSSATPNSIKIYDYFTPDGQTGEQIMLANTVFEPSGIQATSTNAFSTAQIATQDFNVVTTNHAGGEIDTSYFIIGSRDVLRFEIDEQDVASSSDPNLNISALPEHQSLTQMLATLQISSS